MSSTGTVTSADSPGRSGAALAVPPEVFTTPYSNPVGGNPENVRANLREGMRLLKEAGYEVRNQKQVNTKTGEPLTA